MLCPKSCVPIFLEVLYAFSNCMEKASYLQFRICLSKQREGVQGQVEIKNERMAAHEAYSPSRLIKGISEFEGM